MDRRRQHHKYMVALWIIGLIVCAYLIAIFGGVNFMDQTRAQEAVAGTECGNTFAAFGCANWSSGRFAGRKFAISFTARYDKKITGATICWKNKTGYGGGSFGRWVFEIQRDKADDHTPSGEVLVKTRRDGDLPDGYMNLTFPPVLLTAGASYHLVMYNTDPTPQKNWSSPNTIMAWPDNAASDSVMERAGDDWQPWGSIDNPSAPGKGGRAAYLLTYDDGSVQGMPYYSAKTRYITATAWEGESIAWEQPDAGVVRLGAVIFAIGRPAGDLMYVFEAVDGDVLATGKLASPDAVTMRPCWQHAVPTQKISLRKGGKYRFYLKAPACLDEKNCYAVSVPYSSSNVDGWPEMTWGGTKNESIYFENDWKSAPVPADMTFSLIVSAQQ